MGKNGLCHWVTKDFYSGCFSRELIGCLAAATATQRRYPGRGDVISRLGWPLFVRLRRRSSGVKWLLVSIFASIVEAILSIIDPEGTISVFSRLGSHGNRGPSWRGYRACGGFVLVLSDISPHAQMSRSSIRGVDSQQTRHDEIEMLRYTVSHCTAVHVYPPTEYQLQGR